MRNKRDPTNSEMERLREFVSTPNRLSSVHFKLCEDVESEEDADYVPESDAFDYSRDIEDEHRFEEELFAEGMEFALHHIQELGTLHQSEFVNKICDIYADINGAEPTEQ